MSETEKTPEDVAQEVIAEVIAELKTVVGSRLQAIYRFGSEFARKPGVARLLVLVDRLDQPLLDKLQPLVQTYDGKDLRFRIDTPDDIIRGVDTFPVFCLEFRATRELLHGEDLLSGLSVDLSNLRLRVEQGLRVVRRDLVRAYLEQGPVGTANAALSLRQATHRLAYLLDGLLRVHSAEVATQRTPDETFEQVAATFLSGDDADALRRLLQYGNRELTLDAKETRALSAALIRILRPIVDAIDRMEPATS